MRGMYTCLDEGDQHDDELCEGVTWSQWGWVCAPTVEGRICGDCRAWQFRFYDEAGNPVLDERPNTAHRPFIS